MNKKEITPTNEQILAAVELEEGSNPSENTENTAQKQVYNGENDGDDLFNVSSWCMQNYPETERKPEAGMKEQKARTSAKSDVASGGADNKKESHAVRNILIVLLYAGFVIAVIVISILISNASSGGTYEPPASVAEETTQTISVDETIELSVKLNEFTKVYFTPDISGTYRIYSSGETDVEIRITDSAGYEIIRNDESDEDYNFDVILYLAAGEEYRFDICTYNEAGLTRLSVCNADDNLSEDGDEA